MKSVPDSASDSEHTVQRTLLDMGLLSRCSTRWPLLTKRHCQLCLEVLRLSLSSSCSFHVLGLVMTVLCFGERSYGWIWDS
ncbi:hypothetical protein TNCV_2996991 [Trichonephila clavipes]|nr:hypothetical protein TNCV_2996991 [Trichonephila clavipes]